MHNYTTGNSPDGYTVFAAKMSWLFAILLCESDLKATTHPCTHIHYVHSQNTLADTTCSTTRQSHPTQPTYVNHLHQALLGHLHQVPASSVHLAYKGLMVMDCKVVCTLWDTILLWPCITALTISTPHSPPTSLLPLAPLLPLLPPLHYCCGRWCAWSDHSH